MNSIHDYKKLTYVPFFIKSKSCHTIFVAIFENRYCISSHRIPNTNIRFFTKLACCNQSPIWMEAETGKKKKLLWGERNLSEYIYFLYKQNFTYRPNFSMINISFEQFSLGLSNYETFQRHHNSHLATHLGRNREKWRNWFYS